MADAQVTRTRQEYGILSSHECEGGLEHGQQLETEKYVSCVLIYTDVLVMIRA